MDESLRDAISKDCRNFIVGIGGSATNDGGVVGMPALAFYGCVARDARVCNAHGIDAYFSILRCASTLEKEMYADNARQNIIEAVEQVMRTIRADIRFSP